MGTLAAAFALAWTAVAFYVMWLGLEQHRLRRRLDALQAVQDEDKEFRPRTRAA
jgi:CcmD family protein